MSKAQTISRKRLCTTILEPEGDILKVENVRIYVSTVTPLIAAKIIDGSNEGKNVQNRRARPGQIKRIADEMERGAFRFTHQGLAWSASGHLIDGQHRLRAIVKTNTSHRFLVSEGWTADVRPVLDTGEARQLRDHLRIMGVMGAGDVDDYSDLIAVTVNGIQRYAHRESARTSFAAAEKIIDAHKAGLRWLIERAPHTRGGDAPGGAITAAFVYAYPRAAPVLDKAWEDLITGAGLRKGDPMIVLRDLINKKHGAMQGDTARALVFRKVLSVLYLRLRGEKREKLRSSDEAMQFFAEANA